MTWLTRSGKWHVGWCFLVLVLLSGGIVACGRDRPPTIRLERPINGERFPTGREIEVRIRAEDDRGIGRVEFYANRELFAVATPPVSSRRFDVAAYWVPPSPGPVQFDVRAIDLAGNVTPLERVVVEAVGAPLR